MPRSGRPQRAAFVALLLAAGAAARAEAPATDIAAAGLEGSAITVVPTASGVSVPPEPEPVKTTPRPGEKADGADADDPESQAEVDKGAAELEEVRKAEEKAGLLPQAPGAGPRDGLTIGLDSWDPLARDLAAAQGTSIDGAPLADPAPSGLTQLRLAELAGISEDELRAKYDIPVELNDAVVAYIRFFQTDARVHFTKWLGRSTRFMPMMRGLLEKQGLPLDLVYLSMIESGFSTYAYSFAKAAGLWQFVVGTSRRYGLHTDFWVDERRDPIKATIAAARYLKDPKERFHGDWYLAWAGYNAGEGKVDRAIRRESTRDFWRMMSKGRTLRAETKHYVPKLIAAALIAKHPERFGFRVDYAEPWDVDEVYIPDATDLHVIAKTAGITIDQVRDLNPELRRFCTPPGGWTIRLPKGAKDAFVAEFAKLDAGERLSFTEHKVEKGEPLSKIARAYGVSEGAILRTNGLKSYRQVKVGRVLVIPMKQSSRGLLAGSQLEDRRTPRLQGRSASKTVAAAPAASVRVNEDGPRQTYVVKAGDTLWTIAGKFSTTVERLKRLNKLTGRRASELQVGQRLAVKDTES
ncbi:MAG TPA: LysM peptidoglycan-binding domain-containing protein [Myxococcales bacterium]|nr:LysM peptidoglycan-binding domain-containing protein [Myxococcales bacterium]